MYFIYKYIINATTTAINTCNFFYLTLVKGRELFLFTLVTQQGRVLYIFSTSTNIERDEKNRQTS
jgi:hypothetical protein